METYIVSCINKDDRKSRHERIEAIGGIIDKRPWKKTQKQAISEIQLSQSEFYVEKAGRKVKVIVRESMYRHPYLATTADDTVRDNLLELPECD